MHDVQFVAIKEQVAHRFVHSKQIAPFLPIYVPS